MTFVSTSSEIVSRNLCVGLCYKIMIIVGVVVSVVGCWCDVRSVGRARHRSLLDY